MHDDLLEHVAGTSESASDDSGPLDSGTSDSGATTSDGGASSSDTGNADCLVDGMIAANEQCDDANEAAGDGCSNCMFEDGWGCANEPSLCFPACDPLLQDCRAGTGCYPLDPTWGCAPDGSEGGGQQNGACEFVNGCDPGLSCVNPDAPSGCLEMPGCWTTICDLNAPTCPGALSCQMFYIDAPAPPVSKTSACACDPSRHASAWMIRWAERLAVSAADSADHGGPSTGCPSSPVSSARERAAA